MKILHSSDWHLGQHFMGQSREAEHRAFLNWLLAQVIEQGLDAILVAGDIFDTATPPSYARRLYNEFIVALQQSDCLLIILAGNHDSPATLAESESLLACLNTRVISALDGDSKTHLQLLSRASSDTPEAILLAVPFLRSRELVSAQAQLGGREKQQQLAQAIAEFYRDLFQQAQALNSELGLELPIIATGHLTLLGGQSSDSVRDIYIGQLEALNANLLPEFDYFALGHLHKPQALNNKPHWRYSGSPIALSFDEAKQQKQVQIIEISAAGLAHQSLDIPCFQKLLQLKGNLAQIEAELAELKQEQQSIWLSIEVAEQDYLPDLQQRLHALIDGSELSLLQLRRQRDYQNSAIAAQSQTLAELEPEQVFEQRLGLEELSEQQQQSLLLKFRQCFEAAKKHQAERRQQDLLHDLESAGGRGE